MKYGQFLKNVDERAPPQLRGRFFSYKALKKLLKHVSTASAVDPIAAAAAHAEFERALDAAVSAANATFHLEALSILAAYDAAYGDGAVSLLARLRRWRDRRGAGDAGARSALALRAAWCRRYARINTVGLRKIVKKYGKATGDTESGDILQSYWSGVRGGALFLSSPLLTELRAVEALLVPPEDWVDTMAATRRARGGGSGSLSRGGGRGAFRRSSGSASPLPPPQPSPAPRPRRPGKEPALPLPSETEDEDNDESDAAVRGVSPTPHVACAAFSEDDALFEDDDDDDDEDITTPVGTAPGRNSSSLWPRERGTPRPATASTLPSLPSPFSRLRPTLAAGAGPSTASSAGAGPSTASSAGTGQLSTASTVGAGPMKVRPPAALAAASALDAARSDGGMFPGVTSGSGGSGGDGGSASTRPSSAAGGGGPPSSPAARSLLRPPSVGVTTASAGLTRVSLASPIATASALLFGQHTGLPGSRTSSAADAALLDSALKCPICLDYMYRPLGLACGHAFCTECALRAVGHGGDVGSLRAVLGALDEDEACPECRRPAAFAAAHAMRETGALVRARHWGAWMARRDEARERDAARRTVLEARRLTGRPATPLDVLRPGCMDEY